MTVVDSKAVRRLVERNPLVAALVLSVVIHLGVFGGWHAGKRLGWWQHQPTWLVNLTRKLAKPVPAKTAEEQARLDRSIPMTFVEVDPSTATTEEPKDAKFYGAKNSKAANPDPKDLEQPKIDGKQEQIVRLMDNDKPKALPLQPAPPKEPKETPKEHVEEPKPKSDAPGDLALAKPKPPNNGEIDAATGDSDRKAQDKPRTLSEARLRKANLVGEKMKMDGGVPDRSIQHSLNVKSSIWGNYDQSLIQAIQDKWYQIIEAHDGRRRTGKVVVVFQLNYQGYVKKSEVIETTVGELQATMCESAIVQAQSFGPWTSQMMRDLGSTTREITFTFFYNGN